MKKWMRVCHINDLPPQSGRAIQVNDTRLAIFRTVEDHVYVLEDRCPHKKGPLSEGLVHGKLVACPLHDWNIDLATGNAVYPDKGCVRTFAVRIDADEVYVALDATPREDAREPLCH